MNKKKLLADKKQQEEQQVMEKSIREYINTLPDVLNNRLFWDLEVDNLGGDTIMWVGNVAVVQIEFPAPQAKHTMIHQINRIMEKIKEVWKQRQHRT